LGFSLCSSKYASIAATSAATLRNADRRIRLSVISAKNRSTWFSHDPLVGVPFDSAQGGPRTAGGPAATA
jgi:hypothetical protein